MKTTTLATVALLATAVLGFSTPAAADNDSCTATPTAPCTFHCHASQIHGQTWNVHLAVSGSGLVGGSADCGSVAASCAGLDSCTDYNNVNWLDGDGTCKAGANSVATCSSNPYVH